MTGRLQVGFFLDGKPTSEHNLINPVVHTDLACTQGCTPRKY